MNPHNKKTKEQLEEYLKCVRALKVGDRVVCDVYRYGTPRISQQDATVVYSGSPPKNFAPYAWDDQWVKYPGNQTIPLILIGALTKQSGFYPLADWALSIKEILISLPEMNKYAGFEMVAYDRILITKIIKR